MFMKCAYHPEKDAVGACVNCGRMVCSECRAMLGGKIYCKPCAGEAFAARPTLPVEQAGGAIASLVCAIIGYFFLGIVLGPIAIALATGARRRIRENPELGGNGIAIAGLVIGIVDTVLWGIFVLWIIIIIIIAATAGA